MATRRFSSREKIAASMLRRWNIDFKMNISRKKIILGYIFGEPTNEWHAIQITFLGRRHQTLAGPVLQLSAAFSQKNSASKSRLIYWFLLFLEKIDFFIQVVIKVGVQTLPILIKLFALILFLKTVCFFHAGCNPRGRRKNYWFCKTLHYICPSPAHNPHLIYIITLYS